MTDEWEERHVLTEGYNDGRDCSDLFAKGIVKEKYYAWLKEHMITGPIRIKVKPKNPKPKAKPKVKPELKAAPTSNVTALVQPEPDPAFGLPPEFSEDNLAEKFTEKHARTMKYCSGAWFAWREGRWQKDDTAIALDYARKVCKVVASDVMIRNDLGAKTDKIATTISSRRMYASIEQIARTDRQHVISLTKFDANPWILNTPGGIVDLKTGQLRPARVEDYCTYVTNTTPGGECPRWLQFLNEATNDDPELIRYLQRIAGYCLTGAVTEHKFFFCYGGGGNGKGTFLNTLDFLLGTYSKVSNMDTFTESRFAKHSTELAFLHGARLINAQEIPEGAKWNEARIKTLTGGDPITARHMYESEFTFYPTFKLLFSGNNKPILRNVDAAMKRRMYLIPFDYEVPEEKREGNLQEHLNENEGGGILQWAIDGCLDWQLNSLNPPARVRITTDEYFESEDKIGSFFDECCESGPGMRVSTSKLYQRYREWCEENGDYAFNRKRFLGMIRNKGYHSRNQAGQMTVSGLKLPDAYIPR